MKTFLISSAVTAFISVTAHATCTTIPVTFKVTDITAAADTEMFVNGNQSALGQWSAQPTNQITKDAASQMWTGTLQLPPATRFQFKFFKRGSAKSGAKEIWETGIATYSENREAITPACGTKDFTIDSGDFRQAEQPHNPFRDNLNPPQGKKGERLQALVETMNANSPAATRAFVAAHLTPAFAQSVPMEAFETAFAQRFARTGGMDLRGLRNYVLPQPDTTALLQARVYGNWFAAFVAFDDAADSRISAIGMQAAQSPRLPAITHEQLIVETRVIVERACKANMFSGTVLVAAKDKTLLEIACGEASKRHKVANNIDTKFNLGSMNKMFTAVAISQLVEKGKLAYTDTIDKYVDETWLPKTITSTMSVHQLLSHTSGLGNYFNDKFWSSSRLLFREVNDYKPLVTLEKPEFKPGTAYRYSNTGMLLLGVVIERASGNNYFDYIRDNITKPAGMTNTDSFAMDDPVENLAVGHIGDAATTYQWKENSLLHVLRGGPAGGGYSTVGDLHKFGVALQNGKLLKPETVAQHFQDHSNTGYGYGSMVRQTLNGKVVGHGGGFPSISAMFELYLDKGFTVVVLANHDGAALPVAQRIGQILEQIRQK